MALPHYQLTVVDNQGNVVPNANVEVRAELPGAALAALKADREGTIGKDNPGQTDADGYFDFFVTGGAYSIWAYLGAPEAPTWQSKKWRYVAIGLNSEGDGIGVMTKRTVTEAGTVDIPADDADEVLIEKAVGEATTVNLPPSAERTKAIRIIDGKGDAATNNITVVPESGESIYGTVDYHAIVDGNGGSVKLTPRPDGTGWY